MLLATAATAISADEWSPGSLVISEVAWAGSSVSSADEWLELLNRSSEPVSLAGWSITAPSSGELVTFALLPDLLLEPGGVIVIGNNPADHQFTLGQSVLRNDPAVVASAISLSNEHLFLELRDPDGVVQDQAGNGGAPFYGSSKPPVSMVRRLQAVQSGGSVDAWEAAIEHEGFDANVPDLGTPGSIRAISVPLPPKEAPAVPLVSSSPILITEILTTPGPGQEEFIELTNVSDQPLNMTGWVLNDAAGANGYRMSDLTLSPGSSRSFPQSTTRLKLNNDGETVFLIQDGTELDRVEIPRGKLGMSWQRGLEWQWVVPSPAEPFRPVILPQEEMETHAVVHDETHEVSSHETLASLLAKRSEGVYVRDATIEVTVTVPLGEYQARRAIVTDGGEQAELQLSSIHKEFPYPAGTRLSVVVTVSTAEMPRLLLRGVPVILESQSGAPLELSAAPALLQLVRFQGIVDVARGSFTVQAPVGVVRVTRKRGLVLPPLEDGDEAVVTGIVLLQDPLTVRILHQDGLRVVSHRSDHEDSAESGAALSVTIPLEAPGSAESNTASESMQAESFVPVRIPVSSLHPFVDRLIAQREQTAEALNAVAGARIRHVPEQTHPLMVLGLTFGVLVAILGDWLWQHLATQLLRRQNSQTLLYALPSNSNPGK